MQQFGVWRKFGVLKLLIPVVTLASALFAQPPRPPMGTPTQYAWWEYKVVRSSLNLTEAQTKQLNSIQASYVNRLMDMRAAANKAEGNLEEVFNQAPSDDSKAEAAINQYSHALEDLTRTLSTMSLQMRNVLTAEQWQTLQNRQGGRGQGRGPRRGPPSSGSTTNKPGPAISQK
jgi:Spy/CpxP family protein refolding chaperone